MHSYFVPQPMSNPRAKEFDIVVDKSEFSLLDAHSVYIEDENAVKKRLNFDQYRYHYDYYTTDYKNIDNFIWAMYSKKKLCKLIRDSGTTYDYILICRPDMKYESLFDVRFFDYANENTICCPNNHVFYQRINDRFFILTDATLDRFGDMFDHLLDFSKRYPVHPEQFIYDTLVNRHNIDVVYIPFLFNRVRANGVVISDSTDPNGLMPSYEKAEKGLPYKYVWSIMAHFFNRNMIVWITMINLGYVEYTKNFLKSMERNKCPFKIIVFCVDNETALAMKGAPSNCIWLSIEALGLKYDAPKELCEYVSKEYTELVYLKLDVTRKMMDTFRQYRDYPVGFIDTDIVLLADPTKVIMNEMKRNPDFDIFSQCNEKQLCTDRKNCPGLNSGVIVYRNRPDVAALLEYTEADVKRYRATQAYLIAKFKRLGIKRLTIETNILLNGSYPGLQSGVPAELPKTAVLVHYNWVIDVNYKKRDLMREQKQWYLDDLDTVEEVKKEDVKKEDIKKEEFKPIDVDNDVTAREDDNVRQGENPSQLIPSPETTL
jgi:hypothetical protein